MTVNLGLRYDNQYKSFNNHLDLTPVPRLRELIDPASRGDHNNFGPRARGGVGCARTMGARSCGRAYGIVLPVRHAGRTAPRADGTAADQHRHQQSDVSRSVWRAVSCSRSPRRRRRT